MYSPLIILQSQWYTYIIIKKGPVEWKWKTSLQIFDYLNIQILVVLRILCEM